MAMINFQKWLCWYNWKQNEKKMELSKFKNIYEYIIQTKTNNGCKKYELFVCLFHKGPDVLFVLHCQI